MNNNESYPPGMPPGIEDTKKEKIFVDTLDAFASSIGAEDETLALEYSLFSSPKWADKMEETSKFGKAAYWLLFLCILPVVVMFALWRLGYSWYLRARRTPRTDPRWIHVTPNIVIPVLNFFHPVYTALVTGVTTSKALDAVYSAPVVLKKKGQGWWHALTALPVYTLLMQPDGKAVRNRARQDRVNVRNALVTVFETMQANGRIQEIRVLVLACGSAQPTLQAVRDFLFGWSSHGVSREGFKDCGAKVRVQLVDRSEASLRQAVRLAQHLGISEFVEVEVQDLGTFMSSQPDGSYHIVEMVGFLDYRGEGSFVRYCKEIRRLLCHGGFMIVAQIAPSRFWWVVSTVVNWPGLIRRTPDEIAFLIQSAGWRPGEFELVPEPEEIHYLVVGQRKTPQKRSGATPPKGIVVPGVQVTVGESSAEEDNLTVTSGRYSFHVNTEDSE